MRIKQTFLKTKRYFHRGFRNLRSLVYIGYKKLPKSCSNHICLKGSKIQKLQVEQKEDGNGNGNVCSERRDEEGKKKKNVGKCLRTESRYLAVEALARKMKELDMMDVNDMDHVLDIEEALNYYSRLTCPAYQHIVDRFFLDMYLEFNLPVAGASKSVNNSMRRLGSASFHSSKTRLGPVNLQYTFS